MPTASHFVDGTKTLAEQETDLNDMEQLGAQKVTSYAESTKPAAGDKGNEALLQPVPFGQQPPPLELIALAAGDDVAKAIAAQVSQGKTVVFHETCWVESKETLVIGVRKQK